MIISSSLSISTESENPFFSLSVSSCCGDQTTCDLISDTSSSSLATSVSLNESFEAKSGLNDISTSCIDPPVQPKLATYPLNHRKCSFQSSCLQKHEHQPKRIRQINNHNIIQTLTAQTGPQQTFLSTAITLNNCNPKTTTSDSPMSTLRITRNQPTIHRIH
ncbi:unnamed protein product [Rotaria socialis]|uniref:Uncharacterized protein n=1 Tax=Rotaria socialis TaxID=392032 RepID=A0A821SMX1_9BILA|nr:unnamed protein product [Rotaria socialis]